MSVVPIALNQPAVIVKDAATGLVNKVSLNEAGITFPDVTTISTAPQGGRFYFAKHFVNGSAGTTTSSFTITTGAFTPNLPGGTTTVPLLIVYLAV